MTSLFDDAVAVLRAMVVTRRSDIGFTASMAEAVLEKLESRVPTNYTDDNGITYVTDLGGAYDADDDIWFKQPDGSYHMLFVGSEDGRKPTWSKTYDVVSALELSAWATKQPFGPGVDVLGQWR